MKLNIGDYVQIGRAWFQVTSVQVTPVGAGAEASATFTWVGAAMQARLNGESE